MSPRVLYKFAARIESAYLTRPNPGEESVKARIVPNRIDARVDRQPQHAHTAFGNSPLEGGKGFVAIALSEGEMPPVVGRLRAALIELRDDALRI